jgi:competence protein ComEC
MVFLYLTIAFISGVLLWDNLFYAGLFLIPFFKSNKKNIVIIIFLCGIFQGLYFYYPYLKLNRFIKNQQVVISGTINELKGKSFILKCSKVRTVEGKNLYYHKLKIKIIFFKKYFKKIFKKSLFVKIKVKLEPLQYVNPGTFNFANYYKSKGIRFIAYLRSKNDILEIKEEKVNENFISKYRDFIKSLILKSSLNQSTQGLLIAITTGDKLYVDKNSRNFLIENGISHLFSISGLHVGSFFIFILLLLRIIFFRMNNFYLPFICSIPFIIFYTIFMGANYPAIRAGFIIIALILSLFVKRYKDPYRILFLILFLIVTTSPFSFYNLSLQFSFIVVFALIFYSQNKTYNNKIAEFFSIILVAFLSGFPLGVYYFSVVYPKSVFANIVAVPIFTFFIIPISVALIFFCYIPFLSNFLISILGYLLEFIKTILEYLPNIKAIFIHTPNLFEIICWYLSIFLIIVTISKINTLKFKEFLKINLIILLIIIFSFLYRNRCLNRNIVGIIDNRWNYSVFVKNKFNYLIDSVKNINNFKFKVLPVLLKYGLDSIDFLIIPYQCRNTIENINKLSQFLKIRNIVSNDQRVCSNIKDKSIKCFSAKENNTIGNMVVLYPPNDKYYLLNYKNSSLMLKFDKISFCYYFTKDIWKYIIYKKYSLGKILISYKSEINKITDNDIIMTKKKKRGFLEISLENYKIKNFAEKYKKYSLLRLLLKENEGITAY